jgi:ABC-type Fe3+-hydroxamate transport system substrate-binding protein
LKPDPHETLYMKLAELTDRVSGALKETDPDVLMLLAAEQDTVVKDLQQAGISADSRFLGQVQALSCKVSEVITEIQQRQHDISIRIKQVADGKKLVQAYVN